MNYLCVVIYGHSKVVCRFVLTLCTAGKPTAILARQTGCGGLGSRFEEIFFFGDGFRAEPIPRLCV